MERACAVAGLPAGSTAGAPATVPGSKASAPMPKACGTSAGGDLATSGDAVIAAQQAVRHVMEYMQQQMVRDPAVWGALAACIMFP